MGYPGQKLLDIHTSNPIQSPSGCNNAA